MCDFSQNTRKLLILLRCPREDSDALFDALRDWENQIEDNQADWPEEPGLVPTLRVALEEHRGQKIAEQLAYALARCGCRQPQTISALDPWDSQLLRWRELGLRAQDLWEMFQSVGAAGQPQPGDLSRLDEWLEHPGPALANYGIGNLSATILKGRLFLGSLYHNGGQPDYASLLLAMAQNSQPALALSQCQVEPLDEAWALHFELEGQKKTIQVPGDDTWLNDDGLAREFERVAGRGRVLRFSGGRTDDGSFWGRYLIVNEPQPFRELCAKLGIPLLSSGGWAH